MNAAGTQATLRAVNGTTTEEVLNFPVIRMLGEDGQGNRMYWIEGSYNDLFSQAQPQAEGETAPELRYEDQAEIEMLAASMDREANQDFEEAVDELFAGEELA